MKTVVICILAGITILPSVLQVEGDPLHLSNKEKEAELPYYLSGTIFDSNETIVITPDGLPPDDGVEFDHVLSYQEADRIRLEAREKYIEKYGVDPWKPDRAGPPDYLSDEEKLKLFERAMNAKGDPDKLLNSYYDNEKSILEHLPLFSDDVSVVYASNPSQNQSRSGDQGMTRQRHHPVLGGANPRADFTVSDVTPQVGEYVYFDASCTESHAWIDCYAWDFNYPSGDDAWGKTVTVVFLSPGLYTVKLWVRNGYDHSKTDNIKVDILVGGASGDIDPVADFTISNANPEVGETISFDASSTKNSESITCWAWDFDYGTGDDAWGKTVTHRYYSKGLHTVKLWVREGWDRYDSDRILMDIPVHGNQDSAAHEIDGRIKPKVFFACDPEHKPDPDEWIWEIKSVMTRFRDEFGVWPWRITYYYNVWDASGTGDDSSAQLSDLAELESTYADDDYEFLIGIVKKIRAQWNCLETGPELRMCR